MEETAEDVEEDFGDDRDVECRSDQAGDISDPDCDWQYLIHIHVNFTHLQDYVQTNQTVQLIFIQKLFIVTMYII